MGSQDLITQREVVKLPQFVVEGITTATYGVTPTNPAFTAFGRDATLEEGSDPQKAELREAGDTDRKDVTKIRETNTVNFAFKVLTGDEAFLAWLMNKPAGSATPDESRSLFWSYNDAAGTETFQQFLGCKPQTSTLNIGADDNTYITCTGTLDCKQIIENTTGPTIGTGSYATAPTGTPLTHLDGGVGNFTYNSVVAEWASFSVTVTFAKAKQRSGGNNLDLYDKATQRTITGSVDIYKIDGTLQSDARAVTPRAGVFVVDTGQITLTFGNMLLQPSAEVLSGDTADSPFESKSYEADTLTIA